MIKTDLQLFAKSAAFQRDRRKSKAYANGIQIQDEIKKEIEKEEQKKPAQEKKPKRGEAVSAVKRNEEYQIFVFANDQEKPYTDKEGNFVYRSGAQIADKMIYNKGREGWESKAQLNARKKDGLTKIRKYIIRKRVR